MLIMKFGGTSVGSAERIKHVVSIIERALPSRPVVVVSAVADVTNMLILLATETSLSKRQRIFDSIRTKHTEILAGLGLDATLLDPQFKELSLLLKKKKKLDKRTLDHFLSFGERLCAPMLAGALKTGGVSAQAFPAWEIGMITDEVHGAAEPLSTTEALLKKKITALKVLPVITGYIGKSKRGAITTLGRGGSDYTAALIGAALGATTIQIWKEVDGIMTTDPRLVSDARVVPELAFEEASELAYFGAKVLHPKTILPAMKKGVPVQVLNTFKPEGAGTTIVSSFVDRKNKSHSVEALTLKKGVIAIHISSPEFFDGGKLMSRIFEIFDAHHTSVDVVSTSVASVSLTIDNDDQLSKMIPLLKQLGTVTVERGKAILCAVGGSINAAGVAGRMFTVLGENQIPVEMISQASGGVSMTFVVNEEDAEKALKALHNEYIRP